jgi:hypothetical protein
MKPETFCIYRYKELVLERLVSPGKMPGRWYRETEKLGDLTTRFRFDFDSYCISSSDLRARHAGEM